MNGVPPHHGDPSHRPPRCPRPRRRHRPRARPRPGRTGWDAWTQEQAAAARARHQLHVARLRREKEENDARLASKAAAKLKAVEAEASLSPEEKAAAERKKAIIQAAMERARQKKEEMAAQAAVATGMGDVSRGVKKQIDEVNQKLEQQKESQ